MKTIVYVMTTFFFVVYVMTIILIVLSILTQLYANFFKFFL